MFMIFNLQFLSMICCNSAFEQGNLGLWRYINAFIIIICPNTRLGIITAAQSCISSARNCALFSEVIEQWPHFGTMQEVYTFIDIVLAWLLFAQTLPH